MPVICGDTKEEHDISILRLWDRQCGLDRGRTVLIARDQISSQLSLPSDSLIWAHLWSFKLQTANKTMCDKQLLYYCKWPSIVEVVACSHELFVLYHSKWTSSWKPKVECSSWPPVQRGAAWAAGTVTCNRIMGGWHHCQSGHRTYIQKFRFRCHQSVIRVWLRCYPAHYVISRRTRWS